MGTSVGILFGEFEPLHNGHLDTIIQLKDKHDYVALIAMGDGGAFEANLNKLKIFFADDRKVKILYVDETDLPSNHNCLNNSALFWQEWVKEATNHLKYTFGEDGDFTWYNHNVFFRETLESLGNKIESLPSGAMLDISQKIAADPLYQWDNICWPWRENYAHKFYIYGNDSFYLARQMERRFKTEKIQFIGIEHLSIATIRRKEILNGFSTIYVLKSNINIIAYLMEKNIQYYLAEEGCSDYQGIKKRVQEILSKGTGSMF